MMSEIFVILELLCIVNSTQFLVTKLLKWKEFIILNSNSLEQRVLLHLLELLIENRICFTRANHRNFIELFYLLNSSILHRIYSLLTSDDSFGIHRDFIHIWLFLDCWQQFFCSAFDPSITWRRIWSFFEIHFFIISHTLISFKIILHDIISLHDGYMSKIFSFLLYLLNSDIFSNFNSLSWEKCILNTFLDLHFIW